MYINIQNLLVLQQISIFSLNKLSIDVPLISKWDSINSATLIDEIIFYEEWRRIHRETTLPNNTNSYFSIRLSIRQTPTEGHIWTFSIWFLWVFAISVNQLDWQNVQNIDGKREYRG